MGVYLDVKGRLEAAPGLGFSDLWARNPATWRDSIAQMAPAGAGDADYAELEDRVAELVAGLDECEQEWGALEGKALAGPHAAASRVAALIASGKPFTKADLEHETASLDEEAAAIVTRAKACAMALDQVMRRMQQLATQRAAEWQARTLAQWQQAQEEARRLEALYRRAVATSSAAHVAHAWTRQLPKSITSPVYDQGDTTPFDAPWQDQD